jgi:hypothetical protein
VTDDPRTLPCQSLRFIGPLDFTGHRCERPEFADAHDPLGGPDAHVYDPAPVLPEDRHRD